MKRFDSIPKHAQDLVSLIDEPLLGTLPVGKFEFDMIQMQVCKFIIAFIILSTLTSKSCQHPLIAQSLHPSYGKLSLITSYALTDPSGADISGSSEDMLHSPLDMLVRNLLSTLSNNMPGLPIDIDRNRTDGYGFASSFDCGVFTRFC